MHYRKVCEFGHTHTQCRCASPEKKTISIRCDRPQAHQPLEVKPVLEDILPAGMPVEEYFAPVYEVEDLPTRLDKLLSRTLWWMKDEAREDLVKNIMEEINK